MKHLLIIMSFLAMGVTTITACSNEQPYTTVQHSRQFDCHKKPSPLYEECVEQSSEPYKDYKNSREDLLKKE